MSKSEGVNSWRRHVLPGLGGLIALAIVASCGSKDKAPAACKAAVRDFERIMSTWPDEWANQAYVSVMNRDTGEMKPWPIADGTAIPKDERDAAKAALALGSAAPGAEAPAGVLYVTADAAQPAQALLALREALPAATELRLLTRKRWETVLASIRRWYEPLPDSMAERLDELRGLEAAVPALIMMSASCPGASEPAKIIAGGGVADMVARPAVDALMSCGCKDVDVHAYGGLLALHSFPIPSAAYVPVSAATLAALPPDATVQDAAEALAP